MRQFWLGRLVNVIVLVLVGILYYRESGTIGWYIYASAFILMVGIPISYYFEKRRQKRMNESEYMKNA